MYENIPSPFDPNWYQHAFDQYVSTADQTDLRNKVINEGYSIPDIDGSKSSIFRNEAVLNNTFSEDILRKSLTDIYLNSSHKLAASNHDNTHFFKWEGYMSDMELSPNTNISTFRIPYNELINPSDRDNFKLSQYYRRWITVEDILNNWDIFKWHILLFINQKVYSEYRICITDQEVLIEFKYNEYWVKNNFPVFIYKFDTNFQHRTKITKELCENQWNWQMPISAITDERIANHNKVIVAFNKISESRRDGVTRVEVLGDNLEFFDIVDGYIDLTTMSIFNRNYILSELREWLSMSIFVPKFLHEYPILLPTDVLYRPYQASLYPVYTTSGEETFQKIKSNKEDLGEIKQVYVDLKGEILEQHDEWKEIIRPIVLSDAFENPELEPLDYLLEEIRNIRDRVTDVTDAVEVFRLYVEYDANIIQEKIEEYLDSVSKAMESLYNAQLAFYNKRLSGSDVRFENIYKDIFIPATEEIRSDGISSKWFNPGNTYDDTFWELCASLVQLGDELVARHYVVEIVRGITRRHLWTDPDSNLGKVRFQRPIDESDFIVFEYDPNTYVWRPTPINIVRQFPDVYLLTDSNEQTPSANRVFKAFFFYSDTMNVLNESRDIDRPIPDWDKSVEEYHHEPSAVYRDIFMEKFYWMGIRTIYPGLLMTDTRWEVIENIIDNSSYQRFNKLFLETMDPYYKLGLATYLKSSNFEFPFDDAIDKFKEAIDQQMNDYRKVTNFEVYLNNHFVPSYFDYISKIMDNYDYESRLVLRPSNTFDMKNISPILIRVQSELTESSRKLFSDLEWLIENLSVDDYNINIELLTDLRSLAEDILNNMERTLDAIENLDLEVYSVKDINEIINMISGYKDMISSVQERLDKIKQDVADNNIHESKRERVSWIQELIVLLREDINNIGNTLVLLNMREFMLAVNDLRTYLNARKINPDDRSVIGQVNRFDDPWTDYVKENRNKLFVSTALLISLFDDDKSYTNEEVILFVETVSKVKEDLSTFRKSIEFFWMNKQLEEDQTLINYMDNAEHLIEGIILNTNSYYESYDRMFNRVESIFSIVDEFDKYRLSESEMYYFQEIKSNLNDAVYHLSYLAGVNQEDKALASVDNVVAIIVQYIQYLDQEKKVFDRFEEMLVDPNNFVETMKKNLPIMEALIEYLNTVNEPIIPDTKLPTYSEVFEINEIDITSRGFNHSPGDIIFIPSLASYKILTVSEDIARVEGIQDTQYRKTTFRDPTSKSTSYTSITTGHGDGFSVKAVSSHRYPIINDTVIEPTVVNIDNILKNIRRYITNPNPHNNIEYNLILTSISNIQQEWNDIISVYNEYMTPSVVNSVNDTVNKFMKLIPVSNTFIDHRYKVTLRDFTESFRGYVHDVYRHSEKIGYNDEEFNYYESQVRLVSHELESFVGTGTSWSNIETVQELIQKIKESILIYMKNILPYMPPSEEVDQFKTRVSQLNNDIGLINSAINDLHLYAEPISTLVEDIQLNINDLYAVIVQTDVWYRITNSQPAERGSGYRVGEIVEIVIETIVDGIIDIGDNYWKKVELRPLSDTHTLNISYKPSDEYITSSKKKESLFFQVTKVEHGEVVEVKPFMEYALPYQVWGVYKTTSKTGDGMNLTIDLFSDKVTLDDSTLLDEFKPAPNPLGENDMLVFKFENIHDLNVNYEVFLGGHQITNFVHRHESTNEPLHPKNIDVIYVNANDVLNLKNSSIQIPAEHYFVYKINEITIKDPGAGYAEGQDVYVDAEHYALRLRINKIEDTPYKGIESISLTDGKHIYEKLDPYGVDSVVVDDTLNNLDDEFHVSYYDRIPKDGIKKPATLSFDQSEYEFISRRFDDLDQDNRNATFMYPSIDGNGYDLGDPDLGWMLGSRVDNSLIPMSDDTWNGIKNLNPVTDPFIPDDRRTPPNQPVRGEYQKFADILFHQISNIAGLRVDPDTLSHKGGTVNAFIDFAISDVVPVADIEVANFASLPRHIHDWSDGAIGKTVAVTVDETNNGHRMIYRIRSFMPSGFFVYNFPMLADSHWNHIDVDWMNTDWYVEPLCLKQMYPSAPWKDAVSYRSIEEEISDGKHPCVIKPVKFSNRTYIHNVTIDDLSVFNWTTKTWEDLHNTSRWKLEVRSDDKNKSWGFRLTFLPVGTYSYDMRLYWNKIPANQLRNAELKRNAILDISSIIVDEINTPAQSLSVNTSRSIRIRKLFPYEQKETFILGKDEYGDPLGYEMDFKLAPYIHYKNELQLQDVKVFNKTANRFENILDRSLFEVRFKDDKARSRGYETQTKITQSLIASAGEGFSDGPVWGWNQEYGIHIFGDVTATVGGTGYITTFIPRHCPNPPTEDIVLEFQVYQKDTQTIMHMAVVIVEFKTERIEVFGDGYIHEVNNPMAPLPREFKIISQLNFDSPFEYEVIIDKTSKIWSFTEPNWILAPTFHIPDYNIHQSRLYIMTDKGRFPLVNPSTKLPTLHAVETETGTDVRFLNLYRRYERIEIHSLPYPVRSVYTQRRVPVHGYLDLDGKLNKPLNKKYFEFWMNGKLLDDEVTIISPTKLIMHGLTSLRNFEIIEVNRDPNEYFSDSFLGVRDLVKTRPSRLTNYWNYKTYLDGALEGTLQGDNYTLDEQEYLLTPVWQQVDQNHPSFKDYPPNVDTEDDIILRVHIEDLPINGLNDSSYQFIMLDLPTIEGIQVAGDNIRWEQFGFYPIQDNEIISILGEVWADEIATNPYFPTLTPISENEWYGTTARLYDEYGIRVHTLDESAYVIYDDKILNINTKENSSRFIDNKPIYDLT